MEEQLASTTHESRTFPEQLYRNLSMYHYYSLYFSPMSHAKLLYHQWYIVLMVSSMVLMMAHAYDHQWCIVLTVSLMMVHAYDHQWCIVLMVS